MIAFTVYGKAAAAGSKRGFVRGGRVIITDASHSSRPWKSTVTEAALDHMRLNAHGDLPPPLEGPITVDLTFYILRPKSHYRTGKNAHLLKPSAPLYPTVIPDRGKLARGVEDALSGIVYKDDAQIVGGEICKRYTTDRARVDIRITELNLLAVDANDDLLRAT